MWVLRIWLASMPFAIRFPSKKLIKFLMETTSWLDFGKLLNEYDLAAEGRPSFKFVIEKAPSWLDYYFEFVVYSKEEKY